VTWSFCHPARYLTDEIIQVAAHRKCAASTEETGEGGVASATDREQLEGEFEAARASGLRVAEAAAAFRVATNDLEWALWATDPASHEDAPFNHDYAARRLAEAAPKWRNARDNLHFTLEQDTKAIR
jgi:hypothetical protein